MSVATKHEGANDAPRKATPGEVAQARIEALCSIDMGEVLPRLKSELGQQRIQIAANETLIDRLASRVVELEDELAALKATILEDGSDARDNAG